MRTPFTKFFFYSGALLLFLTGAAKLYSATGTARILTAIDPLLQLTYRPVMFGVGLLEAAIALYLVSGHNLILKPWLVFWLSCNFMLYRFANAFLHVKLCPCLGTLGSALPISKTAVDTLLLAIVLYLFFGSSLILLRLWSNRDRTPGSSDPIAP